MDDLLQQGITAYKAGKRDEARKIFIAFIKQNPESERGWGWMYDVSGEDKERIYCLQQMLRINPKQEKAKQLLDQLLAPPLIPVPTIPTQAASPAIAEKKTIEKKQGIFIPAFKIGFVLALVNTFVNGLRIWNEHPSQAYIISLGGGVGEVGLLAYRLSMLIGAGITNFILWFIVALVIMFIVRQIKKA
jgi:hypothetical protein